MEVQEEAGRVPTPFAHTRTHTSLHRRHLLLTVSPRRPPARLPACWTALLLQSGALFDSLTVGENVGFLLNEHTDLPPAKVDVSVAVCVVCVLCGTWPGGPRGCRVSGVGRQHAFG